MIMRYSRSACPTANGLKDTEGFCFVSISRWDLQPESSAQEDQIGFKFGLKQTGSCARLCKYSIMVDDSVSSRLMFFVSSCVSLKTMDKE